MPIYVPHMNSLASAMWQRVPYTFNSDVNANTDNDLQCSLITLAELATDQISQKKDGKEYERMKVFNAQIIFGDETVINA